MSDNSTPPTIPAVDLPGPLTPNLVITTERQRAALSRLRLRLKRLTCPGNPLSAVYQTAVWILDALMEQPNCVEVTRRQAIDELPEIDTALFEAAWLSVKLQLIATGLTIPGETPERDDFPDGRLQNHIAELVASEDANQEAMLMRAIQLLLALATVQNAEVNVRDAHAYMLTLTGFDLLASRLRHPQAFSSDFTLALMTLLQLKMPKEAGPSPSAP